MIKKKELHINSDLTTNNNKHLKVSINYNHIKNNPSNHSRACELSQNLGTLRNNMLSQFTGQNKPDDDIKFFTTNHFSTVSMPLLI